MSTGKHANLLKSVGYDQTIPLTNTLQGTFFILIYIFVSCVKTQKHDDQNKTRNCMDGKKKIIK